jgi:hypothetical protein
MKVARQFIVGRKKVANRSNSLSGEKGSNKKMIDICEEMNRSVRIILGILEGFLALNAFGGGYYGMNGAEGVPIELLDGSPFKSYFIPGLFLFVFVGGSFLLASIAVFTGWRKARMLSFAAVAIVLSWLAVQVYFIGYISWMQPTTAVIALVILVLTFLHRGNPALK